MVNVTPLTLELMEQFRPNKKQGLEYANLMLEIDKYGLALVSNPDFGINAYAIIDGDNVLAVYGKVQEWNGKESIWALIGEKVKKSQWPVLIKIGLRFINDLFESGARRVDMDVVTDYKEAERAAKILGFKREGLLEKYSPEGKDCYMYARTI